MILDGAYLTGDALDVAQIVAQTNGFAASHRTFLLFTQIEPLLLTLRRDGTFAPPHAESVAREGGVGLSVTIDAVAFPTETMGNDFLRVWNARPAAAAFLLTSIHHHQRPSRHLPTWAGWWPCHEEFTTTNTQIRPFSMAVLINRREQFREEKQAPPHDAFNGCCW